MLSIQLMRQIAELFIVLAPGEISHSGPGEKNQFQPDKNSQRPRLAC